MEFSGRLFNLCWSLQLQGKVFNVVEVISASHVNVEKKIFNPYGGVRRSIILLDVHGFKPFQELVLHYFIGKAYRCAEPLYRATS